MNNTASTEKDILMMSQRWATTGAMIGLTDDQIVAISASLLSMGVNVEAGGSALQRFGQKVNAHVLNASDELDMLAKSAGMTASEFADAWKNEPTKALEAFLKGLDGVVKEGGNANQLLKDLGITSVNEVNALLALAGGHEQLADALSLSSEAYKENTALNDEFAVFADTASSKLQTLMNRLKDVAITLGGPLLDALSEALDAAEPWIDKLADMAQGFADMDKEGQRNILMWAGVIAAAGPALSLFGKLTTTAGNLTTGMGNVIQTLGKWTTPTAIGGTASALGGLLPLLGVGALAIAGVGGMYAYLNSEGYLANKRLQEFPDISALTEPQAESLREVADEVSGIKAAIDVLDTEASLETLTGSVADFATEIGKLNDEKIETLKENFKTLPTDMQESLAGALEATITNIEQQTARVQTVVDEINKLTQQGMDENGVLQDAYRQQITALTDELMSYYSLSLAENAEQQRQIYQSLTKDITEMNQTELNSRINHLRNISEQEMALYQQQQDAIFDLWKNNQITEQEYRDQSFELEQAHQSRLQVLNEERAKTSYQAFLDEQERLREAGQENAYTYSQFIEALSKELGLTIQETEALINQVELTEPVKNMARAFEEASPMVKTAVNEWNKALIEFAEQAGVAVEDLTTDQLQVFVNGIEDIGMSWADLELLTKEADIDSNVKDFIEEYVEAHGGWEALKLNEKNAIVNTNLVEISELLETWNDLTLEDKIAQIEGRGGDELQQLIESLGIDWNSLTVEQQEAIVNTSGREQVEETLYILGIWSNLSIEEKRAILTAQIDNDALLNAINARDLWNQDGFISQLATINTNAPDAQQQIINLINEWSSNLNLPPLQMETTTNADETTAKIIDHGEAVAGVPASASSEFTTNVGGISGDTSLISDYNVEVDKAPAEKSSGIQTNVFSIIANTLAIGAYNTVVDKVKDAKSNITTTIPGMIANTRAVNDWNSAGRAMFNKSSTLSTFVPNIVTNTNRAWNWINALNSAYNRTSTLTTIQRTVKQNVGFADGGHVDAYADGGNIKWAGMFASGGNVPRGYAGIVGEAGPEIFQVTRSGVSITPLNSREKMRGVEGAIADYMEGKGKSSGNSDIYFNIEINNPVVREETDFKRLANVVKDELTRSSTLEAIFKRGVTN